MKYDKYINKDIRNLLIPNQGLTVSLPYGVLRDFMEYLYSIANHMGFIFISDIMQAIGQDDDFEASGEYGWSDLMFKKIYQNFMYNVFKTAYESHFDYPVDNTRFIVHFPKPISVVEDCKEV